MSESLPDPAVDEPAGDVGDQASRLQMLEEQEAIRAALDGRVRGSDALEEREAAIDPLEGPDALDAEAMDASDDPVFAGGSTLSVVGDGSEAVAVEEGTSVEDDARAGVFERDGDPDVLDDEIAAVDDSTQAEDLDALTDILEPTHDPDDPDDPDGYGVPPAAGT